MIKEQGKYYLYRHIRLDKNEPFYIGIGSKKEKVNGFQTLTSEYERAYTKGKRNTYWKNIVAKTDYIVEILLESDDYDFIKQKEVEFISDYNYTLSNLTKGGEGTVGLEPWNKGVSIWNEDRPHPNKGKKLSDETKRKKSESMKKSPKNLKGKKLPDWWRDRIRQAKIGEKNPMYGKVSHQAKKVVDIETKIEYNSIKEAAESTPYQFQYVSAMLKGDKPNKTNLRYKDGL